VRRQQSSQSTSSKTTYSQNNIIHSRQTSYYQNIYQTSQISLLEVAATTSIMVKVV
jgi:hypothetical protein